MDKCPSAGKTQTQNWILIFSNPLLPTPNCRISNALKTVMLGDRFFDRAESKEMIILDGTTKFNPELRQANWEKHLKTTFEAGGCL